MISQIVAGAFQLDAAKKAMKELEAQGVSRLSPEYMKMQGIAEEMASQGFTGQEIQAYLNQQLTASNAAYNAQKNMAGGNLAQAMGATQALQMQQANAAMAAKDAELKRSNVQTLFNVYQTLQGQKNLNQDRFDKQMGALQNQYNKGLEGVVGGLGSVENLAIAGITGGASGMLSSVVPSVTGLFGGKTNNPYNTWSSLMPNQKPVLPTIETDTPPPFIGPPAV
jgi:hypothetical protein